MEKQFSDLEQRVLAYCGVYRLFEPGDGVVLGVSGGADSVCLLFMLHRLREELGIKLYVVHVNHGLRPEAGGDADYVEQLCRELDIPFSLVEADVQAIAGERGCSTEEAGRQVRYESFEREMRRWKAQKIAVAHHAGDRAETMLFHLFRGTGLVGLGSIQPMRGSVVRPLLELERSDIETYLNNMRVSYRHDSTNDTDAYARNRIRHHILPYAEREICRGAAAHLCHAADIFSEIEDYMEEQIRAAGELCVTRRNGGLDICCATFAALHPALQKGLLLALLRELSPAHRDMGARQVEQVLDLCVRQGNRELSLPQGICAGRCYEYVTLERLEERESAPMAFCQQIRIPGAPGESVSFQVWGGVLQLQRMENKKNVNLLGNPYTKWMDCDKIEELLEWRTRRTGDYLEIRTSSGYGRKLLKNLFIDEKLPVRERDRIPLLTQGSHILWVAGGRISERCRIHDGTRQIVRIEYRRA
ncbi:MAG: tRNA lysidine(34) synthetase TilS [bacterium]|nr:tRNA lysidine(34) synthetase TilS [bacterium]MCM1374475.1 tRNA lysidine(34) synthetase TilS [Muribaculum sp.]